VSDPKPPVKLWRYQVPSIKLEGWAIVVIGSDGYFSAVSDWGNYSFRWSNTGCPDFRDFVLGAVVDPGYWINKLGGPDVYDGESTLEKVKEYLADPKNFESEEERQEELELLEAEGEGLSRTHDLYHWQRVTKIQEPWFFHCTMNDPHASAFVRKGMPRICALIQAELDAERGKVGADAVLV
jgi:hypothetical protein